MRGADRCVPRDYLKTSAAHPKTSAAWTSWSARSCERLVLEVHLDVGPALQAEGGSALVQAEAEKAGEPDLTFRLQSLPPRDSLELA